MSIRNLDHMFRPRSVAVIGASRRPHSVGATVMRNLLLGGFDGPIMPVNPKYEAVAGVLAYASVADLPEAPDLAVVCTPPATVPPAAPAPTDASSPEVVTAGPVAVGHGVEVLVTDGWQAVVREHGVAMSDGRLIATLGRARASSRRQCSTDERGSQ